MNQRFKNRTKWQKNLGDDTERIAKFTLGFSNLPPIFGWMRAILLLFTRSVLKRLRYGKLSNFTISLSERSMLSYWSCKHNYWSALQKMEEQRLTDLRHSWQSPREGKAGKGRKTGYLGRPEILDGRNLVTWNISQSVSVRCPNNYTHRYYRSNGMHTTALAL